MKILLVDDDELSRNVMNKVLVGLLGHDVTECADGHTALQAFQEEDFPLVVSDIRMPGISGLDLLREIKSSPRGDRTEVVLVTGFATLDAAVDAMRKGAADFLRKPVQATELLDVINRVITQISMADEEPEGPAEPTAPSRADAEQGPVMDLPDGTRIGLFSASMRAMTNIALRFHEDREVPVLIEGETGTGKEMIAKLIHYGREVDDSRPFISVNCAAITPSLFESELFGYVGGAFTGALKEGAKGKLEAARGGTIFFDEIGEVPLPMQPKLLRALQERTIYRVGGTQSVPLDIRVIAATNRDLEEMIAEGTFRRDLYYRLNVGRISAPPLRRQPTAIAPMAQMFLREFARTKERRFQSLAPETVEVLEQYAWPGNIRELQNVIEHAVLLHDDLVLRPEHLAALHRGTREAFQTSGRKLQPGRIDLPDEPFDLDELNTEIVRKTLERFNGNKSRTADFLGMTRSALRSRLQKLDES